MLIEGLGRDPQGVRDIFASVRSRGLEEPAIVGRLNDLDLSVSQLVEEP